MTSARHRPATDLVLRAMGIVAIVAMVATACGGSTSSSSSSDATSGANAAAPKDEGPPTPGGTLRVGVNNEIDGLDPNSNRWSVDGNLIASSVFDTLLTLDEQRNIVPRLALSVTANDDGTVWTMKLRPNVTFSDGTPFDATAVKANIEARKAQPLTSGAIAPINDVAVVDPLTVQVNMNTPWFGYDYTLTAQGGMMAAPSQINSGDERTKHAVGTGPFTQVGDFTPGQPIKAVRNENYWGDKAYLDGVSFTAMIDAQTRTQALKAGDLDMIFTDDAASILAFRSGGDYVQVEDVAAEEAFAMLNLGTAPFDNIHARKALAYATNRQAIVDALGPGVLIPAEGPFTEGEKYYNPDSGYPSFDQTAAKAEVDAYKQDTGASSLSFTIKSDEMERTSGELLQAQWAEVGIDAKIETIEQASFLTGMFLGDFQVAMFRNFAWVNPDSDYIFWHSSQAKGIGNGSINFGQIKDPALDQALDTARATSDEATRTALYIKLTPTLNASVPYIWTFHNDWALAATKNVGGLSVPQKLGFARQDGKPWWPQIWLKQ